jgi:hypothetical protein
MAHTTSGVRPPCERGAHCGTYESAGANIIPFWILDFGFWINASVKLEFWIGAFKLHSPPIQNPKSKIV